MFTLNPLKQYPVLSAYIYPIASSSTAWAWGTLTQVVPVSTITNDFMLVGVHIFCNNTITVQWQVQFTYGGSDTELATFSGASENDTSGVKGQLYMRIFLRVPANSVIKAKVTDNNAVARNYGIRIYYIEV